MSTSQKLDQDLDFGRQFGLSSIFIPLAIVRYQPNIRPMDSTYAERRRPSRDTVRNGYVDDDVGIPHRGVLQSTRRLQETQALLASPGPLESMLKTTTETGDIGVFSMGPSRSSSHSRTPVHPRANSGGSVLARTMSMDAPERRHLRDDRRGLPSHRDTTSEIISLYGSNGQRSMPGAFSRSPEDPGPRSYSLTSCSSRYMSDQKSTGTWESRSSGGSGGMLARPRSPYPYHTRLKRPGVRPSSPALTSDGIIDYSRMVEVERRPSYRTIHRYYNRSYPPNPSRHPHPRHRPYDTRITRSLPGDGDTFVSTRHGSVAARPHSPWVNHGRYQPESNSSDQSGGVSSITSIVQMYGSPAQPVVRQPPISRTGSFYYDYSEDFQDHPMPVPFESASPMPRTVSSTNRSIVLDNSCEPIGSGAASMGLCAAAHIHSSDSPPPPSPACSRSETDVHHSKLQCQSDEEDVANADALETGLQDEYVVAYLVVPQDVTLSSPDSASSLETSKEDANSTAVAVAPTKSPSNASEASETVHSQKQDQSLMSTDESATSDAEKSATSVLLHHTPQKEHPVGDTGEEMAPATPSATTDSAPSRGSELTKRSSGVPNTPTSAVRRRSNVYSLQPGLLDLKSFVQDLDDAGLLHEANVSGSSLGRPDNSDTPVKLSEGPNVHALLARTNRVLEAETGRISTYRSMREPAVPCAITRLKSDGMSENGHSPNSSKSIILAPQPISPARQLRLRSSVSKLMKALPPLPPPTAESEPGSATMPRGERELPELPALPRVSLSGSRQSPSVNKSGDLDRINQCGAGVTNNMMGSNAYIGETDKDASRDIYGDIWDIHFGEGDDPAGTVVGMGSSSSGVAHTTTKRIEDVLHTCQDGTGPYSAQLRPLGPRGKFKSSTMRSKPALRESSAHLNSISQARGASFDTGHRMFQKLEVQSKDPIPADNADFVNNDVRLHRGLKKRLSDFKIRLTESRHRQINWSSSDVRVHEDADVIGMAVPVTSSTGSPESSRDTSNSNSPTDESSDRGFRYKVSRWMKSAKKAVNSCKRLSSSTGGASLDTDF